MRWCYGFLLIILLKFSTSAKLEDWSFIENSEDKNFLHNEDNIDGDYSGKLSNLKELLENILILPWPEGISPLVYVEYEPSKNNDDDDEILTPSNAILKRSRFYRKYPWKRQNPRYDAENRYLCQPSKEDVFRLLVALHETRDGSRGQMINFCNRRRPASVVFTNIRYLG